MNISFYEDNEEVMVSSPFEVINHFRNGKSAKINNITYRYEQLKIMGRNLQIYIRSS
ncbi:hypothetical protein [Bacillus solimangrovi]|uniref:hypothetical protein n=1 Tax=Bacillus solimangrovi TaxID=1305675 RepID=UPI001586CB34|nr:hypothetical protein [Bacillus solimangrovi]